MITIGQKKILLHFCHYCPNRTNQKAV